MLSGSADDSEWLEKYRQEKTLQVRAARLKESGDLVSVGDIQDEINSLSNIIRQAGETLQRNHGTRAYEILDNAISEFETQADDKFSRRNRAAELVHGIEEVDFLDEN